MVWVALAAGVLLLLALAALWAPARATILVDTPTSTARADIKLLWGLGPRLIARALPRESAGAPLAVFNDAARIGHALMTPGLADVSLDAIVRLFALKPRVAKVELAVNTGDYAKDLVIQTAVQAAVALAPAVVREKVAFSKCAAPGAELSAKFELIASPPQLNAIWRRLRTSKPGREFVQRLRRKPKPAKKPVREVRAS